MTLGSGGCSELKLWHYTPAWATGTKLCLKKYVNNPAKLSFTIEGKIKSFMNKQVLRDFITTRPALQELLKEELHTERNNQY